MAASVGLIIASAAFSAVGAIAEGNARNNAAKANARVAQRNAVVARDNAASDAAALNRDNRKRLGLIRANFGSSGIALEGSALDVLEDNVAIASLNELNVIHKGELRALGFEETGIIEKEVGSSSQVGGFISAGSEVFTGVSKAVSTNLILEANA